MKSKRTWLWCSLSVVLAAVLFGVYRKCTAEDYLRILPSRPKALVSIDLVRLSEESSMNAEALKSFFPDEWNRTKTGICWTRKIYAFVSSKDAVGVLAAVEDADELEDFLQEMSRKGRCRPVEKRQGYRWTVLNERWMMGFDDRALLVMGSGFGGDVDVFRQEILKCFRQETEESGTSSSVYKDLSAKEAAFAFATRMDVLPTSYSEAFLDGLPEHANLNDINLIAAIHFTGKGVEIDAEAHSANSGINKYYEQLTQVGGKINGEFVDDVPADALAWACVNLDGSALLEQLRAVPSLRTFLLGLNMNVDADRMLGSIKGDVAFTVHASGGLSHSDYLVTAQLTDKDFLKEADYWKQSAEQSGQMTLRDMGNHHYYMSWQDLQAFFGVEGENLYVTSAERMVPSAGMAKAGTLSEWKDDVTSGRFFVWVNLEQLRQQPEVSGLIFMLNGSSWKETVELFSSLTLYSSDARHLTLKFNTKDNKHALKELLEQWIR